VIDVKIPSKREKKPYTYTGYGGYVPHTHTPSQQTQVHQPPANNVVELKPEEKNKQMFDEAIRRDRTIKKLNEECTYKVNDRVMFMHAKDEKKYGSHVIVDKILSTYGQWPKNEPWPENDNPMIVHVTVKDRNDEVLFCTTNMLKPYNSVEAASRNE
jgi:hypothetical protein